MEPAALGHHRKLSIRAVCFQIIKGKALLHPGVGIKKDVGFISWEQIPDMRLEKGGRPALRDMPCRVPQRRLQLDRADMASTV